MRLLVGISLFVLFSCSSGEKNNESAEKKSGAIKVACVGEQTTHSAHRENDPEYPTRLIDVLGEKFEVANFGLPKGKILRNAPASETEDYYLSETFKESQKFGPDVVVFGPWGRHDTYDGNWPEYSAEFADDLSRVIKEYINLPSPPQVFVVLPLPFNGSTEHRITGLLEPTKQVAEAFSLPVIDLWNPFLDHPELYKDGTHLSPEGQQKQAEIVGKAIQDFLSPM